MYLKVINPYDQKILVELPFDGGKALEAKVAGARKAAERWRRHPLAERARRVEQGLKYFRSHAEEIALDITLQMGKPLSQARNEVKGFFHRAEYMLSIAQETLAPEVLPGKPGFQLRIEHTPLGVVYNIAPWNYPLLTAVNVVVPALLAGNTVLLKHSPLTPLIGRHFESAFGELDPPNLVTSLILTNEQASRLIGDPRINYIAFTGSVATGTKVYQQAAKRLIDAGLELGGKDPAYVAADADLDFAVENIVDGACYNAGQSCCAVERVYVHRTLYQAFLKRAKKILEEYRLGDPLDEKTTMGPLARREALPFLEGQVKEAVRRGARLLLGGQRRKGMKGNFFDPTLLADVPNGAKVMQEESFGPIVPVLSVADDAEALARMSDSRYGLTASIWTRDRMRAELFARELEAGTLFQNRCDYLDPCLPWTGAGESGIGSTLSKYGFYHLTRRKGIHFRERK
ncbi:MAG: aldehyde dehydrogenase family protein [Candidatus Manganitrophaceae bacterium]|nr:MAG: aldehyde dehydrogenase family protein [Candidatus Manganitrophaceae bacterium]